MEILKEQMWTKEKLNDPVWFIQYFFRCKLWEKESEIARSVRDNKITAVRSCHASGKSFDAARIALWFLLTNPNSKVITTAPSWTQVKEILWREIHSAYNEVKEVNDNFKFEGRLLETKYDISPDWFAIGLATRKEGSSADVADRLLGFHSKSGKILIIVDEGPGVQEAIWNAIEGLMTSADVKLLVLGNPYRLSGTFYNLFRQKGVSKIWVQDTDIPNIKYNKPLIPGLMAPHYPKMIEEKYGKDSNTYLVKVKGCFPKSEEDTLISLDILEDAFNREAIPQGEKKLGVDVARYGSDRTVFLLRQGKAIIEKKVIYKSDLMEVAGLVKNFIRENNDLLSRNINVDVIGYGAGVVDRLREDGIMVNGINVGSRASNPEEFSNLRAEASWRVKDWIKEASIPRDDDYLEIANIKYAFSSKGMGQKKIEGKDEMKKRLGHSPDIFDALMLTFADEGLYVPFISQPTSTFGGGADLNKRGSKPILSGLMKKKF